MSISEPEVQAASRNGLVECRFFLRTHGDVDSETKERVKAAILKWATEINAVDPRIEFERSGSWEVAVLSWLPTAIASAVLSYYVRRGMDALHGIGGSHPALTSIPPQTAHEPEPSAPTTGPAPDIGHSPSSIEESIAARGVDSSMSILSDDLLDMLHHAPPDFRADVIIIQQRGTDEIPAKLLVIDRVKESVWYGISRNQQDIDRTFHDLIPFPRSPVV
jgi:hypothetical protein